MNKSVYFLFFTIFLITGCASVEGLVTDADPGVWHIGYQKDFGMERGYIREFVPRGEKIDSWSRLITIQFLEKEKRSATNMANEHATEAQKQCPGTKYEMIDSDTYNAYYSLSFPSCKGQPAQSEISRFVQGNDGLHRLSYAVKNRQLTVSEKTEWMAYLRRAYVAKGDRNNKVR
jgi:hypothetical protein